MNNNYDVRRTWLLLTKQKIAKGSLDRDEQRVFNEVRDDEFRRRHTALQQMPFHSFAKELRKLPIFNILVRALRRRRNK